MIYFRFKLHLEGRLPPSGSNRVASIGYDLTSLHPPPEPSQQHPFTNPQPLTANPQSPTSKPQSTAPNSQHPTTTKLSNFEINTTWDRNNTMYFLMLWVCCVCYCKDRINYNMSCGVDDVQCVTSDARR